LPKKKKAGVEGGNSCPNQSDIDNQQCRKSPKKSNTIQRDSQWIIEKTEI